MNLVEAVLRRDRWIVLVGLVAITVLAWSYVWDGAGMGMSALDMTAAPGLIRLVGNQVKARSP